MAKCLFCEKNMKLGVACVPEKVLIGGREYPQVLYSGDGPCGDCRVPPGSPHHPGCDQERCPRCKGQLISCGCLEESDGDEDEERA